MLNDGVDDHAVVKPSPSLACSGLTCTLIGECEYSYSYFYVGSNKPLAEKALVNMLVGQSNKHLLKARYDRALF